MLEGLSKIRENFIRALVLEFLLDAFLKFLGESFPQKKIKG
jgi:hypothetical protein